MRSRAPLIILVLEMKTGDVGEICGRSIMQMSTADIRPMRNYDPQKPIQKICGGANVDDYDWTRKVLETTHDHTVPEFHGFMDGLSLHYYVHPEG